MTAFKIYLRWILSVGLVVCPLWMNTCKADEQTAFIVDMTHAFYVTAYCPGFEVINEGFVSAAKTKNLNPEIVDQVRNGVAFLNSEGKNGIRPPKLVMGIVTYAATTVALDHKEVGVEKWCEHRIKFLSRDGFVRKAR